MGILGWGIGPGFPVGLARLELNGTPQARFGPGAIGAPGDSEALALASTKETQGQEQAQKDCALAALRRGSLPLQLSPRRSQTGRAAGLPASCRYVHMGYRSHGQLH